MAVPQYVWYILIVFVTLIISSLITVVICYLIYKKKYNPCPLIPSPLPCPSIPCPSDNSYDFEPLNYCSFIPESISYNPENSPIPIPLNHVYNKATAVSLFEIAINTSIISCLNLSTVPLPAEFTSSIILNDPETNIIYGIIYYNDTKAVIVFSGSFGLFKNSKKFDYTLSRFYHINHNVNNNTSMVNAQLSNIYTSFCKDKIYSTLAGKTDIMITGHSLGGALSIICAVDVYLDFTGNLINSRTHYAFASPRVGDDVFSQYYSVTVSGFNVINSEDIIPQIPSSILPAYPYEQIKNLKLFTNTYFDLGKNHYDSYLNFMP